jgi:hypothetical protein
LIEVRFFAKSIFRGGGKDGMQKTGNNLSEFIVVFALMFAAGCASMPNPKGREDIDDPVSQPG